MRSPKASMMIGLALLCCVQPATARETGEAPFVIPETAPSGAPEDWCATGWLSPEGYQEAWTWLRRRALDARVEGDAICEGLILTQLADLTSRQDIGRFGVPYQRRAEEILRGRLPAVHPLLARIDLSLGFRSEDPEESRRRLERGSAALRNASNRTIEPSSLDCSDGSVPDPSTLRFVTGLGYQQGELRGELFSAQLRLLRLDLQQGDTSAAVRRVDELADLVEDGAPRDAEPGTGPRSDYELPSLLEALLPLAGNGLGSDALQRLVVLTSRLAGSGDLPSTSAKRSLADMLGQQGLVEDAEQLLLTAIDERLAFLRAERQRRQDQDRYGGRDWDPTRNDASYSLLVGAVQELYEKAGRVQDEELLLQDSLRFAESFGDDLEPWLTRLGYFYQRQGRLEDRERVLRRALALHPDVVYIRQQLVRVLLETGRPEEADIAIENLVDVARGAGSKPGQWGLAGYLDYAAEFSADRGRDGRAAQLWAEASEVYAQVLESRPKDWSLLVQWADIERKLGRLDEADQLLQRAAALSVGDEREISWAHGIGLQLARAKLEFRRHRPEAAEEQLATATVRCHEVHADKESSLEYCLMQVQRTIDEAGEADFR